MKKLTLAKYKKELEELNASEAVKELIYSTIQHHNDLVNDYNKNEKHQQYLCYQLKQQIFKMLNDLKKASGKEPEQKKSFFEENFSD